MTTFGKCGHVKNISTEYSTGGHVYDEIFKKIY